MNHMQNKLYYLQLEAKVIIHENDSNESLIELKMRKDIASLINMYGLNRVRHFFLQNLFSLGDADLSSPGILSDERVVDIIMDYIHTNYSKDISLNFLCELVYVNRTTLTRKFKARTRRTPIDYLLHYRLSIACELLTNTKQSIGKISETVGFKYESYFTRQFAAKIGMTPSEYRYSDGFEILDINESRIVEEF